MSRPVRATKADLLAAIADAVAAAANVHPSEPGGELALAIRRRLAPLVGEHTPTSAERGRVRAYLDARASYDRPPGRPTYGDHVHGIVPLGGSDLVTLTVADLRAILDGKA